jgi:hypothetical protein
MVIDEKKSRFLEKRDIIHLAILLATAIGVGIYLIATTVLIAKDGVLYIENARKFSSEPMQIIRGDSFGYPFLIVAAHKLVSVFSDGSSVYTWIYSAQGVNLLCRLLAIVSLYFIGKTLMGGNKSFWAILILAILPHPARFGSDVLRDWPNILFLSAGFLCLLWGAEQNKWWVFGLAGFAAGLGHIIRPECAQIVVYGVLWLLMRFFLPKRDMSRPQLVYALLILLVGFAIPAAPYMKARGQILPGKLKHLVGYSCWLGTGNPQGCDIDNTGNINEALVFSINTAKAVSKLVGGIGENLMYYFLPALLIGVYYRFRRESALTTAERFFIPVFIAFNILMLILLFNNYGYIDRRHVLPLAVFTIFYVPAGLQVSSDWLTNRFSKQRLQTVHGRQLWFFILFGVGVSICLPNLFKPIRVEKQSYKAVANWLRENTSQEDIVGVPDMRISLYAERDGVFYAGGEIPAKVGHIVKIVEEEGGNKELNFNGAAKEEYSSWIDRGKKKKLVVYRMM